MSFVTSPTPRRPHAVESPEPPEKRVFPRHVIPLSGRYMRPDKSEHTCTINDISIGGVSLTVPISKTGKVAMDERVVVHLEQVGLLEGQVIRVWTGGFAFKILATQHKRE